MSFYRVTTPTHRFTLPISTDECDVIQITYQQGKTKLIKGFRDGETDPGVELDEDVVLVNLTQEETKAFDTGDVDIQLRALTSGGKAYASQHFRVGVSRVNTDDILKAADQAAGEGK